MAFAAAVGKMRAWGNIIAFRARPDEAVLFHTVNQVLTRQRLERLCRYIARPPLPASRLETRADGSVWLQLKRIGSDGTRQWVFSPLELVEK